jgi:hypothetical protein
VIKTQQKQVEGSESSTARGMGEKHQKSREREVNHPQQGEWVKPYKNVGRVK